MKYTVIYTDQWHSNSGWHFSARIKRILLRKGETIADALDRYNIRNPEFLFKNWPALQGESKKNIREGVV